jgi:hypothetical protein
VAKIQTLLSRKYAYYMKTKTKNRRREELEKQVLLGSNNGLDESVIAGLVNSDPEPAPEPHCSLANALPANSQYQQQPVEATSNTLNHVRISSSGICTLSTNYRVSLLQSKRSPLHHGGSHSGLQVGPSP